MNVLMNCLPLVSGGAVSYLRNLVPLLIQQFESSAGRHELKILLHESQRDLLHLVASDRCIWVDGPRPHGWRRMIWERRHLAGIAQSAESDVVFTPYQIGPRIAGAKQVLMLRNMEPFHFRSYRYSLSSRVRNRLLAWQSTNALRNADRAIAVSGFAEQWMIESLGIPESRIQRVYHGRDTSFSADGDLEADRERLEAIGVDGDFMLTCGSLLPYRRYEDVIEAFDRCAGSFPKGVQLVIAGSGTDKRYEDLIRAAITNSPYRKQIFMVGHVSKEAMVSLYRRCLVCIISTEIEACPNIAIEAMSSGCAIVSSDRPPLPEIFAGNSLTFTARDVDDMSKQMYACLNDPSRCEAIRVGAEVRASDFSWESCAEETYTALVEWPEG